MRDLGTWISRRLISFVAMLLVLVVGTAVCFLFVHAIDYLMGLPLLKIVAWMGVLAMACLVWMHVDDKLWD